MIGSKVKYCFVSLSDRLRMGFGEAGLRGQNEERLYLCVCFWVGGGKGIGRSCKTDILQIWRWGGKGSNSNQMASVGTGSALQIRSENML